MTEIKTDQSKTLLHRWSTELFLLDTDQGTRDTGSTYAQEFIMQQVYRSLQATMFCRHVFILYIRKPAQSSVCD